MTVTLHTDTQAAPSAESPFRSLRSLLEELVRRDASDLHLTVGQPPMLRCQGELVPAEHAPQALTPNATLAYTREMLQPTQQQRFEQANALDFAFSVSGLARFRGNVFRQRSTVACAIRVIPARVPDLHDLKLPEVVTRIAEKLRGLVLVTGPTGSGKSTTLAAIVNHINATRANHIITLEHPIEFIHPHRRSIVNQREIGVDVAGFAEGLHDALREDPDVILVGEMRDLETIASALTIAETGHLCLATLHAHSAPEAINRIVDSFPSEQQAQIRQQLSATLEAVITQDLVPVDQGAARALCCEILLANNAVRTAIREQKTAQLASAMQIGGREGMQTMNQDLIELVTKRRLTVSDAIRRSSRPQELEMEFKRLGYAAAAR